MPVAAGETSVYRLISTRNLIIFLALTGIISIITAGSTRAIVLLMALSFLSNVSYSCVSRSAVRNSALYHAIALLLSNIAFYSVLYRLKTDNLNIQLFIPYTVATVFGSVSGAVISSRIEDYFGITTSTDKTASARASSVAKKFLLALSSLLVAIVVLTTKDIWTSVYIAGLVFGGGVSFSIVRRSRNSNNTTYHIFAFLFDSLLWFLLYRKLSLNNMALTLFPAYCLGSIFGGLTGQKTSERIENAIGASADAHLNSSGRLMPWRSIAIILVLCVVMIAILPDKRLISIITALALGQQIAFSLVSRSRNRNNLTYHLIASVFSNGVWFLTFRQINSHNWNWGNYPPYAAGGAMGSITGVGISMNIEKSLNITSETKK